MALGYQGLILLDGSLYLVTDGNLDHARPEIASEGTYAAKSVNNGVGRVHIFDLDQLNGGFNFDTNIELIEKLFKEDTGWITNRDTLLPLLWYSNVLNNYEFGDAYWTRISISSGAGNMTTTSIDVSMIPGVEQNTGSSYELPTRQLQLSDNYIGQKYGLDNNGQEPLLNPITFSAPVEKLPIPFWETSIEFIDENDEGLPDGVYVYNWSVELVNNITRRNLCLSSTTKEHPGPSLIQVGLASMTLNVTFVTTATIDEETGDLITEFNMPIRFKDVIIKIRKPDPNNDGNIVTREISLGRFDGSEDGNVFANPVQEISDASNISGISALQEMSYIAQGYFTLPHIKTEEET